MWDGFTPVDPNYDPILFEGARHAMLVVANAGPGTVRVRAWSTNRPDIEDPPALDLELRPGNIRMVAGALVRVATARGVPGDPKFAAVGWAVPK